jgi:uncharacterized membrane protein
VRMGCASIVIAVALAIVLPLAFADLLTTALLKLQLRPGTAALVVLGIFGGSLVNIPVKRIPRADGRAHDWLAIYGLHGRWPALSRIRRETIVAVNVGGCVVPASLAVYETLRLVREPGGAGLLALAVLANVAVCYLIARPVAGIGITMPAFPPAAVACLVALFAAPAQATPLAFVAGVAGPLIGADLLHLRDVGQVSSGVVSIGGAGTFDGILLTGILALYLA